MAKGNKPDDDGFPTTSELRGRPDKIVVTSPPDLGSDEIRKYKEMLERGLITEEEYKRLREELLRDLKAKAFGDGLKGSSDD